MLPQLRLTALGLGSGLALRPLEALHLRELLLERGHGLSVLGARQRELLILLALQSLNSLHVLLQRLLGRAVPRLLQGLRLLLLLHQQALPAPLFRLLPLPQLPQLDFGLFPVLLDFVKLLLPLAPQALGLLQALLLLLLCLQQLALHLQLLPLQAVPLRPVHLLLPQRALQLPGPPLALQLPAGPLLPLSLLRLLGALQLLQSLLPLNLGLGHLELLLLLQPLDLAGELLVRTVDLFQLATLLLLPSLLVLLQFLHHGLLLLFLLPQLLLLALVFPSELRQLLRRGSLFGDQGLAGHVLLCQFHLAQLSLDGELFLLHALCKFVALLRMLSLVL
mmetsp:Transcript_77344/g.226824  ORF Transcript_77344/g.226824 Transcript_77344/m.226824 type:complete len:335 (+) Transcript_77344:1289-2293(+)